MGTCLLDWTGPTGVLVGPRGRRHTQRVIAATSPATIPSTQHKQGSTANISNTGRSANYAFNSSDEIGR